MEHGRQQKYLQGKVLRTKKAPTWRNAPPPHQEQSVPHMEKKSTNIEKRVP